MNLYNENGFFFLEKRYLDLFSVYVFLNFIFFYFFDYKINFFVLLIDI